MNWYTLTELIQVFYDIKWMRSVLLNWKKTKPSDPLTIDPGAHKKLGVLNVIKQYLMI